MLNPVTSPRIKDNRLFKLLVTFIASCLMSVSGMCASPNHYSFDPVDKEFDSIASLLAGKEFSRTLTDADWRKTSMLTAIANHRNDRLLKARAIFWKIRLGQLNAQPDTCITALEKAKSLVPKEREFDYAAIAYQLAGNYERTGQYYTAYQLLQEAIPIFAAHGDYYFLGNAQLLLGLLYSTIEQKDLALEEIRKAGESYTKAHYPTNRIKYFEAELEKNIPETIRLLKESLVDGHTDPGMTIQSYIALASIFTTSNMPDSAKFYLDEGWKLYNDKIPDNRPLGSLLALHEASVAMHAGNFTEALPHLDKARSLLGDTSSEYWLKEIYRSYYIVYDRLGNRDKAYSYLVKYKDAFENQYRELQQQEVPKAYAREAINKQKAMLAEIEHERRIQHDRMVIVILVVVALLVIAASVLIYLYQRFKMKKIENRELRSNLEQEMIITRLNRENFEKDLQKKECEISSSVLLLSNKNDVLQQISEITKDYADKGRIPGDYVQKINEAVGSSIRNDDGWSRFKLHFDSVHPSFFIKLKEISGELSENDLRLCAYIHIGMRSKDIAAMLGVSPASINTNRYRLRKKLKLAKDDNLEDFIRKI